jgi:hypothetical protein
MEREKIVRQVVIIAAGLLYVQSSYERTVFCRNTMHKSALDTSKINIGIQMRAAVSGNNIARIKTMIRSVLLIF